MKGSVKEPSMFRNYETEKITRKASDAAENLQVGLFLQFWSPHEAWESKAINLATAQYKQSTFVLLYHYRLIRMTQNLS